MKLTKERIVEAGLTTFAEHGYAGLSMRQVAERLDVHAGSLYYHVRNKEALLALLADRVAARAYEAGEKALAALPPEATGPPGSRPRRPRCATRCASTPAARCCWPAARPCSARVPSR